MAHTIDRDELTRIVEVTREEILKQFRPDSCIASVKILNEVLDYFGHTSEPLPVIVIAFNAKASALRDLSVPISKWPEDAWSVGVDGTGTSANKRWDGHLTTLVDGKWLVDPSLDQFSRPAKDMNFAPVVLDATEWVKDRSQLHGWRRNDGVTIMYREMSKPGSWRQSPDWNAKREATRRRVVGAIIRRLKDD